MTAATPTLIHHALDVNSWTKNDPDCEAGRPGHCPRCGLAAHDGDRLRLHGHGRRRRDLWYGVEDAAPPTIREVLLRRYRCTECAAVCTVAPRGIAANFRYAVTAVAVALMMWGAWVWTAARIRSRVSPNRHVGLCEPMRWRSLSRWSRRSAELFGLAQSVHGGTDRRTTPARSRWFVRKSSAQFTGHCHACGALLLETEHAQDCPAARFAQQSASAGNDAAKTPKPSGCRALGRPPTVTS